VLFSSALFIPKPAFGTIDGTTSGFGTSLGVTGGYSKHGKSFRKAFLNKLVFLYIETRKNFLKSFPLKHQQENLKTVRVQTKNIFNFKTFKQYSAPDEIP
jgi:hypothetical protein